MTGLRTGQVAAEAGVNIQTLRYYERRGLLPEPERTLGGHRLYPSETVTTLRVIKAAQHLGFTLNEIASLLEDNWRRHGHERDPRLQERTAAKLREVEAKIADLEVIQEALRAAQDAGCEDLTTCLTNPDCPLSFANLARD